MAVFTAIATTIGTALGITGVALKIFTAVVSFALAVTTSNLIARRAIRGIDQGDGGGRIQLPPATDNKIPVVYGSAFISGPITDAKLSTDQKTMWYVVALAEHTDTTLGSGYTFDTNNVYYDGKKVQYGANGVVNALINTSVTPNEIDDKMSGKINIWLFTNGSDSGVNTGGQTAIQILQDSDIPVNGRWTANDTMTNCAFAVIRVKYDTDAGTTNLGALQVKITNSINKPGDAMKDYLLNPRYGCAVPLSRIDVDSLVALNDYSDQTITFIDRQGNPNTKPRYRINGPIDTFNDCLQNLQIIADACDSWLQYSEISSKWKVVINQSFEDFTTIDDLFLVEDSNLIGGIDITPINLNDTYNEVEVSYPNADIRDQNDFRIIELNEFQSGIMSPNEAVNRLNLPLPVINEPVQAKYIGIRRLLQSREDLTISVRIDYSGIQIEAGDVIRVKHNEYGWDLLNDGKGKLFRVSNVTEEKRPDGTLGVALNAFEYNDTIYADNAITDFELSDNIGISDPNILGKPDAPTVTVESGGTVKFIEVTGVVPTQGLVRYLDFNYGFDANSANHLYYVTASNANGEPLLASESFTIEAVNVPQGDIYWSVTAKNDQIGRRSDSSDFVVWSGPSITTNPVVFEACNANSVGTLVTSDPIANLTTGGLVTIVTGAGELQPDTRVANVISNTQFNLTLEPNVAISNACIKIEEGVTGNNIAGNTITGNNIASNTITSNNLSNTGVVPGSYTNTDLTVGADGRITAAANGTGGGIGTQCSTEFDRFYQVERVFEEAKPTVLTLGGITSAAVSPNEPYTIPGNTALVANSNVTSTESTNFDGFYPGRLANTSSTNGYFGDNSGGTTPPNTQVLQTIETRLQSTTSYFARGGRNGWFVVAENVAVLTPPAGGLGAQFGRNRSAIVEAEVQFFTANSNMTIQLAGFASFIELFPAANTAPRLTHRIKNDTTLQTVTLQPNIPQTLRVKYLVRGTNQYDIFEVGACARVIGSGDVDKLSSRIYVQRPYDLNQATWLTNQFSYDGFVGQWPVGATGIPVATFPFDGSNTSGWTAGTSSDDPPAIPLC